MTQNRNLKRRVRARAAKTGESYTAALRHFRQTGGAGRSHPQLLTFTARSWLAKAFDIVDENGVVRYSAARKPGFLSGIWSLLRGTETVALFRRKSLSLRWVGLVEMDGTEFLLRNRLGFTRIVEVQGGPFDGAVLTGSLFDHKFRLEHRGVLLAEAQGQLLSARERVVVRLTHAEDPAAEALVVVMILDTLIERAQGN